MWLPAGASKKPLTNVRGLDTEMPTSLYFDLPSGLGGLADGVEDAKIGDGVAGGRGKDSVFDDAALEVLNHFRITILRRDHFGNRPVN